MNWGWGGNRFGGGWSGRYGGAGGGVVGGPAVVGGSYAGGSYLGGSRFGFGSGYGGYAGGYGPVGGAGPIYGGDACGVGVGDGCGPGSACGGAAGCGACGVGCGNIAGTTLAVVGDGMGDYVATTTYKYVGMGAGNVAMVAIPGPSCSWLWLLCFLPLLFIPLFFIPDTTTTTTTTTPPFIPPPTQAPDLPTTTPAPGPPGVCKIFGDPHVMTFDGSRASFYSMGEYWMVKSSTVWIQGRYLPTPVTNGLSVTKEIAIGGPFLKSKDGTKNILRISALSASFNGGAILTGFPDEWTNSDPKISVVTDGQGEIMQDSRAGKQLHVVHVKLPLGVDLQINRWNEPGEGDYINTKITMSVQPNQDGHCGNFNGDPSDDTRPLIRSRIGTTGVSPENLLFNIKTPVAPANRPDLNNCPTEKSEQASQLCKSKSKNGIPSHDCMVDVCFGGPGFAEMTTYD